VGRKSEWNRLAAEYGIESVSALRLFFDGKGPLIIFANPRCHFYYDIFQYISNVKEWGET